LGKRHAKPFRMTGKTSLWAGEGEGRRLLKNSRSARTCEGSLFIRAEKEQTLPRRKKRD